MAQDRGRIPAARWRGLPNTAGGVRQTASIICADGQRIFRWAWIPIDIGVSRVVYKEACLATPSDDVLHAAGVAVDVVRVPSLTNPQRIAAGGKYPGNL